MATSSIITNGPSLGGGLSAYHPEDALKLKEKAMRWKIGLQKELLQAYKGPCACCKCDLLNEVMEIHHVRPRSLGGSDMKFNLLPLCIPCHAAVTRAVRQRDLSEVKRYEDLKILKDVSP